MEYRIITNDHYAPHPCVQSEGEFWAGCGETDWNLSDCDWDDTGPLVESEDDITGQEYADDTTADLLAQYRASLARNEAAPPARVRVSVCPTSLEFSNGDMLAEDAYLASIRVGIYTRWPHAEIHTLQVGHRQGDEWCTLNGEDSDELLESVQSVDTSAEWMFCDREDE